MQFAVALMLICVLDVGFYTEYRFAEQLVKNHALIDREDVRATTANSYWFLASLNVALIFVLNRHAGLHSPAATLFSVCTLGGICFIRAIKDGELELNDTVFFYGTMLALVFIVINVREQDMRKRQDYLLFGAGEIFLERYHITGAMYKSDSSEVVQAKDILGGGNPLVALKICADHARFERQLRVSLSGLSSQHVVNVLRSHSPQRVIVMPYGERNLGEAIAAEGFGGVDVDKIRAVATQIASALQHVHSQGFIHGLQPINQLSSNYGA